jgi:hypothetical protein
MNGYTNWWVDAKVVLMSAYNNQKSSKREKQLSKNMFCFEVFFGSSNKRSELFVGLGCFSSQR